MSVLLRHPRLISFRAPNYIFNIETSLITTTTVPAERLTKVQLGRHNIRWQREIRSALHLSSLAQGICSDNPLSLLLLLPSLLVWLTRRAGTRRNNGSPRRPHDLLPRRQRTRNLGRGSPHSNPKTPRAWIYRQCVLFPLPSHAGGLLIK